MISNVNIIKFFWGLFVFINEKIGWVDCGGLSLKFFIILKVEVGRFKVSFNYVGRSCFKKKKCDRVN